MVEARGACVETGGAAESQCPLGGNIEAPVDAREISIRFAEAFCASDLARLASLLAPSFRLRGPLAHFDSREAYLSALRDDPPEPAPCRVIQVSGSGDEAAILYEYGRPPTPVLVAQFNRLSDGLLADARLVFDADAFRNELADLTEASSLSSEGDSS